ncbi:MAG: ATP-binding protein [Saprospiraceae bacterium]|nr:ATP-binding protein [Saprospiraceae bacterium]
MSATHPSYLANLLDYLAGIIKLRLQSYFVPGQKPVSADLPPDWSAVRHPLALFIQEHELNREETLLLLMALAPHIKTDFYELVLAESLPKAGDFPQLGGVRSQQSRVFLPTAETLLFMLAGDDLERRILVQKMFLSDHIFSKNRILWLEDAPSGEPIHSAKVIINPEYIELFIHGKPTPPRFGMNFPAERIETLMDWNDLVLNEQTRQQVNELNVWLQHHNTLMEQWGMKKRLKQGYRALFHGPPGTGKTLTAALLGKQTGRDVYRIDLSMVISKFIGETEKNLSNLFAKAENKDWVLFFDEADALFGKRTNVRDAHDKYANQETAYLLQRIENYNGLVILASNFKSNIDEAFVRRFQSIVHFPLPNASERRQLWEKGFPKEHLTLQGVNLDVIAQRYELSGASIMNIVQYCCLKALHRGDGKISDAEIREGVAREFYKEGKIVHS